MADEDPKKAETPDAHVTVHGNMTGNIIVGNENAIQPRPFFLWGVIAGITVLFMVMIAVWGISKMRIGPGLIPAAAAPTSTPVPLGVWKVDVFDNIDLNGSPLATFTQPAEANTEGGYQVHIESQALRQRVGGLPDSNISLRLVGTFDFTHGYFEFHCEHHDGCRVYVDGLSWIEAWWDGGGGHDMVRDLSVGTHTVVIEFYDKSGYGLLEVRWRIKP
ncbi:MAG: hypothetical protein HYZ25_14720 [Chloroflexi bacterium]|nr:hypothetical protein [Chloroflexota bacterium]